MPPSNRALLASLLLLAPAPSPELPVAVPNDNRIPAGALRDGVLTLTLEARRATWYPDGDSLPGLVLEVFGEPGKAPQAPGPLVRVPAGTELQLTVRNTFERDTLIFSFPRGLLTGGGPPLDSLVVPPGAAGGLSMKASVPGNYGYRATTRKPSDRILRQSGLLTGAIVVDAPGASGPPHDRIFVLMLAVDSIGFDENGNPRFGRFNFAINGRSWPRTERLRATVGDSLRWRIINANFDTHPMHLHGFYYRVDSLTGPLVAVQGQGPPGRMVVTERMSAFSAMSLSWVPERAGNWLFHCHWSLHLIPATRTPGAREEDHRNHALEGMAGLVMGIEVQPRVGERVATPLTPRRQLRLLAVQDSAFPDSTPSLRFVLEERRGTLRRIEARPGFSPPIELTRGEPVAITVVNTLSEPTAVHWHGIELDSYYDGVAGFGGSGTRLAPVIEPGDSFEARFTPPRAGTFIYHSHINEPRQQPAGMLGALIVRDPAARDAPEDRIVFLKSARVRRSSPPIEINGQANPDTMLLRAGQAYRFRLIGLTTLNSGPAISITARPDSSLPNVRDTLLGSWRPLAKDGADLPESQRVMRTARQIMGMGETYDFEFVPSRPGLLRLEVRGGGANGRLFARMPIRVE